MLEAALLNLLEGRRVSEANEDCQYDQNPEIVVRFWNQLQVVLKNMLSASLLGSSNKTGAATKAETSNRTDLSKLKEMYRLSLKSPSLAQLHAMHRLWVS